MMPASSRGRTIEALQPVSDMLNVGRCEPAKAAVHAVMLASAGICAVYNTAAWLKRRQRHLGINAIIYVAAFWWEHSHVVHHLAECRPAPACASAGTTDFEPSARDAA